MFENWIGIVAVTAYIVLSLYGVYYLRCGGFRATGMRVYGLVCLATLILGLLLFPPQRATAGCYALIPILMLISVEDVYSHRIANRLLLLLLGLGFAFALLDLQRMPVKLIGTAVYGGVFMLVSLATGGKLGMGDAKLCGVVSLFFGIVEMFSVLFVASLCACLIGIIVIIRTRNAKQEVAFAPEMAVGVLMALAMGII